MIEGLTEGRIVHYVMPDGSCRPAIIVRVWQDLQKELPGYSNLCVFRDGSNDDAIVCQRTNLTVPHCGCDEGHSQPAGWPLSFWATSVVFADKRKHHTWHWPNSPH
jgi:hypothetical protein